MSDKISSKQGQVLCKYARLTIEDTLGVSSMEKPENQNINEELNDQIYDQKRGVFVTLHKGGQLRGCIGSLVGYQSVKDGIASNAKSAAFNDHRFSPVTSDELDEITIDVSILTEPKVLEFKDYKDLISKLRPGVDGVIIRKGAHSATFLPQVWEQLPKTIDFLTRLSMKAGLAADGWMDDNLEVQTYEVQHFDEV